MTVLFINKTFHKRRGLRELAELRKGVKVIGETEQQECQERRQTILRFNDIKDSEINTRAILPSTHRCL